MPGNTFRGTSMSDTSDTGDLWWDIPRFAQSRDTEIRAAQAWVERREIAGRPVAIRVPRDVGGDKLMIFEPLLKAETQTPRDTGLVADERREMRILGQRFFEP